MIARQQLLDAIPHCLTETNLPLPNKYPGKVRDTYDLGDRLLLITTDRQSGFDRMLGAIPYKGQVLNRTSLHWFEATRHIVANHVISVAARQRSARAQMPRASDRVRRPRLPHRLHRHRHLDQVLRGRAHLRRHHPP